MCIMPCDDEEERNRKSQAAIDKSGGLLKPSAKSKVGSEQRLLQPGNNKIYSVPVQEVTEPDYTERRREEDSLGNLMVTDPNNIHAR